MAEALRFFRRQKPIEVLGIGSFGPIDRVRGWITSTPKAGWKNYDIVGAFRSALNIPMGFDTDVNENTLEAFVRLLRLKIDTREPKLIHTVRGIGYTLRMN